jgi:hypothetical protein
MQTTRTSNNNKKQRTTQYTTPHHSTPRTTQYTTHDTQQTTNNPHTLQAAVLQHHLVEVLAAVQALVDFAKTDNQLKTIVVVLGKARSGKTRLAKTATPLAIAERLREVYFNGGKHNDDGCGFIYVDCHSAYKLTTAEAKVRWLSEALENKILGYPSVSHELLSEDVVGVTLLVMQSLVQRLLVNLPVRTISTLDEFYFVFSNLDADELEKFGLYIRDLMLNPELPCQFVVTGSHVLLQMA